MANKELLGTVGLGLMGSSIATCLLASGHEVISLIQDLRKAGEAKKRIEGFLQQMYNEGLTTSLPGELIARFTITDKPNDLAGCGLVIESITENIDAKKKLFHQLEEVLKPTAIIGSNTSAIPVTILQDGLRYPERLLGIHWGEPAHVLRFLEVICGQQSAIVYAEKVMELAAGWGKEPSLVKKDIPGFITNRLMYAMMREAFFLVKNGYATYEDIDRACRNDFGYWITFAGPFRFMDLTGIPAYLTVMKGLFPELDTATTPPEFIEELVAAGAKGVSNAKGFYPYTNESAHRWEKLFNEFAFEIRKLSLKYPQNCGDLS
ncbi:MAG TPA: 3-hydroxyacyl-CoA dehydrogenase family protein [Chitinophagaceae bacterium]|nr:3-hydroxyacyl-CoA dehydrogenase family protein [Chitinophagaceae bacterium]